jgi:hypothetical protein
MSQVEDFSDSEIHQHPTDRELTLCPALHRADNSCHFVICKTGAGNS